MQRQRPTAWRQRARTLCSIIGVATLSWTALTVSAADIPGDLRSDTQLRAMSDELARSKSLKLNDLDKPYFIEYTVSDANQVYIAASFGGLIATNQLHVRQPRLFVRVGDYKFDNTNSIYSSAPRVGLLPVDDDYQAMRTQFWLGTDSLYKASAEQIAHKRAALREISEPDSTPDLAPAKPVQILESEAPMHIEQKHWSDMLQQLSTRFESYANVTESQIEVRAIASTYRLVNSEGTVVRIPQDFSQIEIRSSALAPDGDRIWNHQFITTQRPSQFPSEEQITKAVDSVAAETDALSKAPLAEDYSGPVLFEQEAAAEMMAEVLTDAIRIQRKPLAPPGSNERNVEIESVWSSRLGAKVTPDWLSIIDDPREQRFHGAPLAGYYDVDDQGVPAERVAIVEKGTLKSFLLSREPVRNFNASNGHGRLPGAYGAEQAVIGNLFVQCEQTVPEAQLKAKLLEIVKTSGLKYGILIRRLDFPSTATFRDLETIARQMQKNGYARTLNVPLLAYRVYPDGHEELVRGLRFKEFSAKDLRDVDAASDRPYVLNYVNNGSSYDLADFGTDATTSSVISPSLLFGSLDLIRVDKEAGRLPIVPPPQFSAP